MAMQNKGRTRAVSDLFYAHFEWMALAGGLMLAASFDPYGSSEFTWCLLEWIGIPWCPGEGLGHSIAFMVRGDIHNSLSSNFMGLPAIIIIGLRTVFLIRSRVTGKEY